MDEILYKKTISFLSEELGKEGSHDVLHCIRVYRLSNQILKKV